MTSKFEIEELLGGLKRSEQEFSTIDNEGTRKALLASARALVAGLESPAAVLSRMNWFEPGRYAALRTTVDLKLFEELADGSSKSATDLAKATGADVELLDRLLKVLAADSIIDETGPSEYKLNSISKLLTNPAYQAMVCDSFDATYAASRVLPAYLKKIGYKNPDNKDDTPWQMAEGISIPYFDWLKQPAQKQRLENFINHMKAKDIGDTKRWFSVVDILTIFGPPSELNPESVLLVDVGGNVGHDIVALESAIQDTYGGNKLALQDLPQVVANAKIPSNSQITVIPHDFFTPQPIHGAKCYFLRAVLHDWPNEKCREILGAIVPAMKKGYSKLLINDAVIAKQNAGWEETGVDLIMMVTHAAAERTERHWEALLDSVGLRIAKIWDCEGNAVKLIEAELKDN